MKPIYKSGKVTVIIPCRNEEKFIVNCIESFINQTYPKELLDIFVCDGMSSDRTRDIVKKYEEQNRNVTLLDNPGLTAPKAMNIGIKNSNSEFIIIFGAHSYADANFVKNNVKALKDNKVGCAGGVMETINSTSIGKAIALAMSSPFGVGNALFRYAKEEAYVDTVAFGAYRREVLDKIGYFDEQLVRNQDDELNFRVTKAGYRILLSPSIKSTYYSRASFSNLWRQYYQYGFWKVRVMQKHGKTASIRHLIPMFFILFNFFGFIFGLFNNPILIVWLIELSSYLIGNLLFSLKYSGKEYKLIKYISLAFFILHASYGIGFINGIIAFYFLKSNKILKNNAKMSR